MKFKRFLTSVIVTILLCSNLVFVSCVGNKDAKNDNAIYSFCTSKNKTGDILIGDNEYIPVCSNCYSKLLSEK